MKCTLCKGKGEIILTRANGRVIRCAPCRGTGKSKQREEQSEAA
jgi:DnaJ-class molecular chaperone